MKTARTRPQIGDECWFVKWCKELAFYDDDPAGDVDQDNCKTATRRAETREEAEKIVAEVWPRAGETLGYVEYWPARFVPYSDDDAARYPTVGYWPARFVPYSEDDAALYPHVGYWDNIGDSEYYEGE